MKINAIFAKKNLQKDANWEDIWQKCIKGKVNNIIIVKGKANQEKLKEKEKYFISLIYVDYLITLYYFVSIKNYVFSIIYFIIY